MKVWQKTYFEVSFKNFLQITSDPYNREVAISSSHGHGTARGMAKLYGILANGGKIDGKQLMSKETLKLFSAPKNIGWDLNFDKESVMGRGVFFHTNPKVYMYNQLN